MNSDDDLILKYLQSYPNLWVSSPEVCKRAADKKRFTEDPHWARPTLQRLTQQKVLEADARGYYRIRPQIEEKEHHEPRPESPTPESSQPVPPAETAEQIAASSPSKA